MTIAMAGDATTSEIKHNGTTVIQLTSTGATVLGNLAATGKITAAAQSMIRLNTAAGYGSTNIRIVRFTNTVTSQGTDITYASSATLGDTFTINTNGVYAINYSATLGAGSVQGVSLNSSQLTTSIASITQADILTMDGTTTAGAFLGCATTLYLAAGSVIRAHGDGVGFSGVNQYFTITRVA